VCIDGGSMECLSYCIAKSIDLQKLSAFCQHSFTQLSAVTFPDVVQLTLVEIPGTLTYVFENGTIVCWGVKRYRIPIIKNLLLPFCFEPLNIRVEDDFCYTIGETISIRPHGFFDVDCLVLCSDVDDSVKMSLSYGFSQSVKLQYFETIFENLFQSYSPIIQKITQGNKHKFNRKAIQRMLGEIIRAKSEMNLASNFQYHPKFFWQHPNLEEHYILLEQYLHFERRVNALNHRLNTLNEIFDMFDSYLESQHSHFLEVIIIVLIAIEIIFAVLNFHF
jgi:required for meiotic nuclear division protein 1